MAAEKIRLTQFSHGGGCGCKIAPGVLTEMLARMPAGALPADLLVGMDMSDDAAVYRLNETQALVATTDFFTPVVDDPFDFGRIAAANALSDIYAMGGAPILALALVGMPLDKLPLPVIGRILEGGGAVCRDAGIPIAGGHSIDIVEPVYGLVALGLVHPDKVRKNANGKPGDALILGKPLGIGILSAALKKERLSEADYALMLHYTTQLNRIGTILAEEAGVHAMTDVTGFGLLGHLLEICRASHCGAQVAFGQLPLIDAAVAFAREGIATGASGRNWASYGGEAVLDGCEPWQQALLTDPQTSGGLLVSCAPEAAGKVLAQFHAAGFDAARVIGTLTAVGEGGRSGVTVRA